MNVTEIVSDALFAVFAWCMLNIFIGLCQPASPRKHKRIIWESDDVQKP